MAVRISIISVPVAVMVIVVTIVIIVELSLIAKPDAIVKSRAYPIIWSFIVNDIRRFIVIIVL